MSSQMQHICMAHLLILLSFIINTVHPQRPPPTLVKSARLSPAQTSDNGASVMFNIQEVSNVNTASQEAWQVNMQYENTWQFIVRTDNTFGFDPSQESSISVTIDLAATNTQELLFAFTTDNREYISTSIPMDGTGKPNQIYPACRNNRDIFQFGTGDIASIPTDDRSCNIAGGSCALWQDMIPVNSGVSIVSPLTFILENHPITNELILYFDSPAFGPGFAQECKFDAHFTPNAGLKMYVAGDRPGEAYNVVAFDIVSFVPTPTASPTTPPSKLPTKTPTNHPSTPPTKTPTNYPSTAPSKAPTKTPTNYPSIPPTKTPTNKPTANPSDFPTAHPSTLPTKTPTKNPTNRPTANTASPTKTPTKIPTNRPTANTASPTKTPTQRPTDRPTANTASPTKTPTASPTKKPTIMPSPSPTKSPTFNPSTSPTKNPTNIPTKRPTNNPSASPTTSAPTTPHPSVSPTTFAPTRRPTPFGYQYGAYDQLCPNGAFNEYDQCRSATDVLTDSYGSIACVTPYDCCMCQTVQCGFEGYPCHELRVTGSNGLYGVRDIRVSGDFVSSSGASIDCQGVQACAETVMSATSVSSVDCDGDMSCKDAKISISYPKDGFILECAGTSACEGLELEIILPAQSCTSPVRGRFEIKKILCNSELSCEGLHITVRNEGCDEVFITDLECIQPDACNNAVFDFIGEVTVDNCICGPSCTTATGLEQCFMNLPKYLCKDPLACFAQTKRIINPMNGFEFVCSSVESCRNSHFIIELMDSPSRVEPIEHLTGFLMGGQFAAQDATFVIENKQGFQVSLGRIDCSGYGSCDGTTFITGTSVFVEEINCAPNSCVGCRIKQTVNGPELPCDPSDIRDLTVLQV